MSKFTTEQVTEMSRRFDSGNYDGAYHESAGPNMVSVEDVWGDAYILGWFSSYDRSEIPEEWRDRFDQAYWSGVGQECVRQGWVECRAIEYREGERVF